MAREFFAQFLAQVLPSKGSTERRTAEHRNLNRLSRRCLRHEALEDRRLLSVTNLAETWKSFDFDASGPYSGSVNIPGVILVNFSGSANVDGTATYTSATQGTWTFDVAGTGPWNGGGGSGTATLETHGTAVDTNGVLAVTSYIDTFSGPPVSPPAGAYSGTGAFDPATFEASINWYRDLEPTGNTDWNWTGTLVPDVAAAFDTSPTSLAWNGSDVDIAFQVTGPPTTTTGHNDSVGKVRLYWADGETSSDVISGPLSDELDIRWNQATGSATITSLPTAPSGATHLLLITDATGALTEADEGNNVMALALGGTDIGVYQNGRWYRDINGSGGWDATDAAAIARLGWSGATPVVGDWNGDGVDDIGVYENGRWYRDVNGSGGWDATDAAAIAHLGWAGVTPVVGDWNGDGVDDIGVYQNGRWYRALNGSGGWDATDAAAIARHGWAGVTPVVGAWSSPLMAAEGRVIPPADTPSLLSSDLKPIAEEALASWAVIGLDQQTVASLATVEYVITDLPGAMLGLAVHSTIFLDYNAAGHGWFIDPTPAVDDEFERIGSGESLGASDSVASDSVDLLTVVSHELGHVLGLRDLDLLADSLMSGTLEKGLRCRPSDTELDAVLAGYWEDR